MRGLGIAAGVGVLLAVVAGPASASSLDDGPPARPGPDLLYAKPAEAPQLENDGSWRAKPILISGASAYRDGEFLYQDFLYDDSGAQGSPDPNDPRAFRGGFSGELFRHNGSYTYPTDSEYAGNAADLVELRVEPRGGATAFRVTLNTLHDPSLVAFTIAIGDSGEPREVPHGANATAPAELFLTVHGDEAELVDAESGEELRPDPRVAVSKRRRQIDVRIPHDAWNPRKKTWRLSAGVGLWDDDADEYLIPGNSATDDRPGGGGGLDDPTAFFNVAFRYDEPFQHLEDLSTVVSDPAWWRDRHQANALAEGDLGAFFAEVDFGRLERKADDDMEDEPGGIPTTGPMNRILASRFESGNGGVSFEDTCTDSSGCEGEYRGNLQPYAIYVPEKRRPDKGYGLTLLLHSLSTMYNQYTDSRTQSQFGESGDGSIVITPHARGTDSWYYELGEADVFEVWADVARHYRLDSQRTVIGGYSMGGYGTYKLATRFPDLFAAAHTTVGPPGLGIWVPPNPPVPGGERSNTVRMLGSLRNIPIIMWYAVQDQLVPFAGAVAQAQRLDELGYRYEFDSFPTADHNTLAIHDQSQPLVDFVADALRRRDPPHVTYAVNPTMDFEDRGLVADHAYWLSGLRLRDDDGSAPLGEIDARSHGFGEGDPTASATTFGAGSLSGNLGNLAFTRQFRTWGEAPDEPKRNRLDIEATNIERVTVHTRRARINCKATLSVQTDGPLTVRLQGCDREERFRAGASVSEG